MLKIFEKNSAWETTRHYWKRFVAWGTDLRSKYWRDVFFRTEFNIIFLQVIFSIALSTLVVVAFNYFYKDILQTILDGINESIRTTGTFTSKDIFDSVQLVKAKNFFNFFGLAISLTLIFGYIVARVTLYPTRNALKSQKRFISDIAHELRTPLSVIRTNNEVALLDESLNRRIQEIFKNNIEELDRVSSIINNLLTFNNLVQPGQIKFGPVNMAEIVDNTVGKLDELIEKKKIKLTVKKVGPYTVWGNVIALEQIITNLVKNAINYNSEGGKVTVRVEPDYHGSITLTVEDNGIGISKKDLPHIFEPFYRAERSRNRQYGSSGLGLAIVSELVKLHSGKVRVRTRLGHGTIVTIILPYNKTDHVDHPRHMDLESEISIDFLKKK